MKKTVIRYATVTNPGGREVNEDSVGVFSNDGKCCFVLCDGLGGHGMGDVASGLVKNVFGSLFYKMREIKSFLQEAFNASQEILLIEQKENHAQNKMKTTAVALVTDEKNAYIGHVGDSRLYVFHKNKVKIRTRDHSIPQMLVLSREIKEEEIRNHPDRNIVLKVMGVEWEEEMFELMKPIPMKRCQAFLLCSDGFWELIDEKQMCELLKTSGSPEEWLNRMEEIVKANGIGRNMDNYSAIAIWKD